MPRIVPETDRPPAVTPDGWQLPATASARATGADSGGASCAPAPATEAITNATPMPANHIRRMPRGYGTGGPHS
jgi:hypothetical protein